MRLIMHDRETWLDLEPGEPFPKFGDRTEVIRGNGPREGETMGWATVTTVADDDGGLDFTFELDP